MRRLAARARADAAPDLARGAAAVIARGEDGALVERYLMTLALTCDHRILYGADAARFLAAIRDLLEQPLRLGLTRRNVR